jgi:hypothetical protein
MIEKVMLNVTLKAGKNVWLEGEVLTAPLPPDIQNEIYANTGTVKVIQGTDTDVPQNKLVFVAERVKETASSMTTMAVEPPPDPVSKPKPKLLRRK